MQREAVLSAPQSVPPHGDPGGKTPTAPHPRGRIASCLVTLANTPARTAAHRNAGASACALFPCALSLDGKIALVEAVAHARACGIGIPARNAVRDKQRRQKGCGTLPVRPTLDGMDLAFSNGTQPIIAFQSGSNTRRLGELS